MKKRSDLVTIILFGWIIIAMELIYLAANRKATKARWKRGWAYTREYGGNLLLNIALLPWAENKMKNGPMMGGTYNDESEYGSDSNHEAFTAA